MEGLRLASILVEVEPTVPGKAGGVSNKATEKESSLGIFRNHLGRLQAIPGKGIGD